MRSSNLLLLYRELVAVIHTLIVGALGASCIEVLH